MNYQNYASFNTRPVENASGNYGRHEVPSMTVNNVTLEDIFRTPFLLNQDHHKNYKNMAETAIKGIQCQGELSKTFFSDQNIRRLQKQIKNEIFKRTNGEFRLDVDQEQRDLYIVMRAVYLEYAKFLPNQVIRQVKGLNEKVVSEIVPGMITEMKQEYGYIKEINKPLSPIARPLNMGNAGRKQLPSITTTFGV